MWGLLLAVTHTENTQTLLREGVEPVESAVHSPATADWRKLGGRQKAGGFFPYFIPKDTPNARPLDPSFAAYPGTRLATGKMVHVYPQRASLEGLESEIFKMTSYGADPRQWAEWLRIPLEHAAARGNLSLVDKLLGAGADGSAGWAGCGGRTVLQAAALGGNEGVVSSLLRAGAQPDVNVVSTSSRRSALYVAAKCGHEDAAKILMLAGADPTFEDPVDKSTVLHEAVDSGHKQLVCDLLIAGACPNARHGGQEGYTPLHLAASRGHLGALSALLAFGADIDALDNRGALPIHHAISHDHVAATESLLAAGADQTAGGSFKPFFLAAGKGNTEILKVFFKHGADVNFRDSNVGLTALHAAVATSSSDGREATAATIHALIDAGAKINVQRLDGGTPLHYAVAFASGFSSRNFTLALLQRGASVNLTHNITIQTPLQVACQHQRPGVDAVVDLLLRWGANEKAVGGDGRTALDLLELGIHGDRAAFTSGTSGREERCLALVDEVNRARALLVRAEEDRAWRRRCLPLILRWRSQRSSTESNTGGSGCIGRTTKGHCRRHACTLEAGTMVPTASRLGVASEAGAGITAEADGVASLDGTVLEGEPLSLEGDGERSNCGGGGEGSIVEGHWGRVIATLVGLASEELFRTIVGFL